MLSVMTTDNIGIQSDKPSYFKLENTASVPNKKEFDKFLNWLSGEFELYLQEHSNGFKIYFPGGWLAIHETEHHASVINFNIVVKSKYQQKAMLISNQIHATLAHLLSLKTN